MGRDEEGVLKASKKSALSSSIPSSICVHKRPSAVGISQPVPLSTWHHPLRKSNLDWQLRSGNAVIGGGTAGDERGVDFLVERGKAPTALHCQAEQREVG